MSNSGFAAFQQPLLDGGTESPLVIGGRSMQANFTAYEMSIDNRAVFAESLGGGHVHQGTLESAAAPRSLNPMAIEITIDLVSEDQRMFLMAAPALAASGILEVYVDSPIVDVWVAQAAQTVFVMSRSTFYGGGPGFASRPARVFIGDVEQVVVDGVPGAGQFGIDQSSNGNILTAGTAPGVGAVVFSRFYPLMRGGISFAESITDFNTGDMEFTFTEFPFVKRYE